LGALYLFIVNDDKIKRFLAFLVNFGDIHTARAHANITFKEFEALRKNSTFNEMLMEADSLFCGNIQKEMVDRAINGTPRVLTYKGEVMYERTDSGMMILDEKGKPIPITINEKGDKLLLELFNTYVKPTIERKQVAISEEPPKISIEFIETPKKVSE
jgi:hypothetical protein